MYLQVFLCGLFLSPSRGQDILSNRVSNVWSDIVTSAARSTLAEIERSQGQETLRVLEDVPLDTLQVFRQKQITSSSTDWLGVCSYCFCFRLKTKSRHLASSPLLLNKKVTNQGKAEKRHALNCLNASGVCWEVACSSC